MFLLISAERTERNKRYLSAGSKSMLFREKLQVEAILIFEIFG